MKRVAFAFITLLVFINSSAQEPAVEIKKSTEKVIINGKIYFLHVVQQAQTAYSISKAYGVTLQNIAAENPGLILEQLKLGQVIKIPVSSDTPSEDDPDYGLSERDFILHKVEQGENAYSLSRRYNVPLEVLYSLNPGTEAGLQINQEIRIPKRKVRKDVIENVRDYVNYFYYDVKRKDTLYSLSKHYGVAVADIIDNNPELRWGLKTGMTIKIPKISRFVEDTIMIVKDTLPEEFFSIQLSPEECDSLRQVSFVRSVDVALMLPFFADFTIQQKKATEDISYIPDEHTVATSARRNTTIKGDYYFEFYEGILLALDTLRQSGVNINLRVYDTERDTVKVKKILGEFGNKKTDIIIGPVFPETFKVAAKYASLHDINIVSPIYSRTIQLRSLSNAYQFIPSREKEYHAMAKVASLYSPCNIIFIQDADTVNKKDFEHFKNTLLELRKDIDDGSHIMPKEIWYSDTLFLSIRHNLVHGQKNLVVNTSNNEAYVSELLSFLDRNLKSYDIMIVGPSSWLTFNNIDLDYYHNLELNVVTPFYIDYKNSSTKRFVKKSINMLGYEPLDLRSKGYNLTFLGYDIALYFISAYITYGKEFQKCTNCLNVNTLLNKYSFVQNNPSDGFENTSMILLKFNKDYTISRISSDSLMGIKKNQATH